MPVPVNHKAWLILLALMMLLTPMALAQGFAGRGVRVGK